MTKVLIADKLSAMAAEIFRANGIEADVATGLTPKQLVKRIAGYDGLAVRSATKVTADVLAAASRLKVVGRAGIGVDNIDVAAATARGVVVMNTPFGNAITTAEHTIAMMLALARQLPAADRSTRAGKWQKSRFMGVEVAAKVLGLIGCGNVGSIVANRAQGLKMRVIAYDPFLAPERAAELGVEKVGLDELYARADIISLHTPLTEQTRDMIDARAIARMKPGVRIINCARGGLVVETDLAAALESGHVAGAALDVFAIEPATENPLFGMDQVVVTPHLGAATSEAQENVARQIAEQMSDFLTTGAVTNALNMPSVTAEEAPKLRPYMKLARQLGRFAGQLTRTGLKAVTVEYEGHVATLNTQALTAIVIEGLLSPVMDSVNMVNAPLVARQRNIGVSEITHARPGDYLTLIRLTVTTEKRSRSVAGTLFADNRPRVVEIKGINIEAELGPHMLYITNEDKPGIIGRLGMTLADAGVNIATFHLGRAAPGGDAIALIEIDGALPADVLGQVRAIDGVFQATALEF
ncbi:MAG: phosphoglycerate dehydrogenase [Proteobacteria bacterium]|nr:phosphoglycerate dehydrogenase [Pseudomonadota bacterium]